MWLMGFAIKDRKSFEENNLHPAIIAQCISANKMHLVDVSKMPVSFRSELFTSCILTIFKQWNRLPLIWETAKYSYPCMYIHCPPKVPSHSQFYNFFTDIVRKIATNHMKYNLLFRKISNNTLILYNLTKYVISKE